MDSFLVRFPAFLVLDSSPFAYWLLSPLSSFGAGVFCPQLSFCFSSLQCFVTDMPRGGESSRIVCPSVVAHCDAAGSRVSMAVDLTVTYSRGSVAPRRSKAGIKELPWNRGCSPSRSDGPPVACGFAAPRVYEEKGIWYNVGRNEGAMGLVKTRRLMAMQKQQRAKAGMKPPMNKGQWKGNGPSLLRSGGSSGRKDAR